MLMEMPFKESIGERWITSQHAVSHFCSGESATPIQMKITFRTSPSREVDPRLLATAEQKTVATGDIETTVGVMVNAYGMQDIPLRCESLAPVSSHHRNFPYALKSLA